MSAVRAPQSKAPRIAFSIWSGSIRAIYRAQLLITDHFETFYSKESASCHTREDTVRLLDSPPMQAVVRHPRTVDIVGPAVQENHGRTIGGTGFTISNI
jgi:hypothetical protein